MDVANAHVGALGEKHTVTAGLRTVNLHAWAGTDWVSGRLRARTLHHGCVQFYGQRSHVYE